MGEQSIILSIPPPSVRTLQNHSRPTRDRLWLGNGMTTLTRALFSFHIKYPRLLPKPVTEREMVTMKGRKVLPEKHQGDLAKAQRGPRKWYFIDYNISRRGEGFRRQPSPSHVAHVEVSRPDLSLRTKKERTWNHGRGEQTCGYQEEGGGSGMDWELRVNKGQLLPLEWISSEILLYSSGNYI